MKPQPGDVVVNPAKAEGEGPWGYGERGVIDGSYHGLDFDDPRGSGSGPTVHVVTHPRAYRDGSIVDVSGGPTYFAPISKLVFDGTTEQAFWKFKNGIRRAHNGEDYKLTVNQWRVES